jgi:hypothetical protein
MISILIITSYMTGYKLHKFLVDTVKGGTLAEIFDEAHGMHLKGFCCNLGPVLTVLM